MELLGDNRAPQFDVKVRRRLGPCSQVGFGDVRIVTTCKAAEDELEQHEQRDDDNQQRPKDPHSTG